MMNDLEKRIISGILTAHRRFEKMTDWWLWMAPESFIQHEVVRSIARNDFIVFPEMSPAKIKQEHGRAVRGRPLGKQARRQRFDIVVWQKSQAKVRAIIEIKRGGSDVYKKVIADAKRLEKYLRNRTSEGAGYLLFYSEAPGPRRTHKLDDGIDGLEEYLEPRGWNTVSYKCYSPRGYPKDKLWSWSVGLLKYANSTATRAT